MQKEKQNPLCYPRGLYLALAGLLLISLSLACNLPGGGTGPAGGEEINIETGVAQTMTARAAEDQQPEEEGQEPSQGGEEPPATPTDTLPPPPTNTPAETFTPSPTNTPTQTPTITPSPTNTLTLTPEIPMVQVSMSTNCRVGPGKVYDQVGVLLAGEEAEVIAKDPQGSDWYIRNPDQAGGFCWIWGQYATVSGDTTNLPVFTPPPTPTPSQGFTVSYHEVETCGGDWFIEYKIVNNGNLPLLSASTTTTDTVTGTTVTANYNQFLEMNGCATTNSQNDLLTGEIGYTLSNWLGNDPTGHNINAAITVCTEDGQGGTCQTKNISFTP